MWHLIPTGFGLDCYLYALQFKTWWSWSLVVLVMTMTTTMGVTELISETGAMAAKADDTRRLSPLYLVDEDEVLADEEVEEGARGMRSAPIFYHSNSTSSSGRFIDLFERPNNDIFGKNKKNFSMGKETVFGDKGRLVRSIEYTFPTVAFPPGREPKPTSIRDEKAHMTVPGIIRLSGFESYEHHVETLDGYKLSLFRIRKLGCPLNRTLAPVLLHHGFFGSSADWLMVDKDRALPFRMVDEGFDVWLANARGTRYSNGHVNLTTSSKKYWDFSFHEIGKYDLPAYFDYILSNTQRRKRPEDKTISYIGHSMGTTVFYICMSENPKYNGIIDSYIGLSPAAYLFHLTSPARFLTPLIKEYDALRLNGPLIPRFISSFLHRVVPELCFVTLNFLNNQTICDNLIFFLAGTNPEDTNTTVLQTVLSHFPGDTSLKTLIHFLQFVEFDEFRQFDYGLLGNFKRYGQPVPPTYNLFQVTVNTVNYYGQSDLIIDRKDAEKTAQQTGTSRPRNTYLVYDYNHLDFIWSDSATYRINSDIVEYLQDPGT